MTLALDLERARDLLLLSSQAYLPPAVELPARLSAEGCRPLLGADNLPERQDLGREGSDSLIAHAFTIDPEREIVVAFPGAKINWNYLTGPDLEILQKNLPREYDKAADFVDRLHREHPNAHIIATGHSLGGADAEYVASQFPYVTAVTFGAPGIKGALEAANLSTTGDVYNYIDKFDPIGHFGVHVGKIIELPAGPPKLIAPHFDQHGRLIWGPSYWDYHYLPQYIEDLGLTPEEISPAPRPHVPGHAYLDRGFRLAAFDLPGFDAGRADMALALAALRPAQSGDGGRDFTPLQTGRFAVNLPAHAGQAHLPPASAGATDDLIPPSASYPPSPVDLRDRSDLALPAGAEASTPNVALASDELGLFAPAPTLAHPSTSAWLGGWAEVPALTPQGTTDALLLPDLDEGEAESAWMQVDHSESAAAHIGRAADVPAASRGLAREPHQHAPADYGRLEGLLSSIGDKVAAIDTALPRLDRREVIRIVKEWIRRECNKPCHSSWRYDFGRTYTPPGPIPPC